MCSWCYAFSDSYQYVKDNLPEGVILKRLLGGLARDTDETMPDAMREHIRSNWQKIEQTVPGVNFNHEFWTKCQPRRATYLSCRAVIAARQQGEEYDEIITRAIQQGYYQNARNPSELETLIQFANEIGLDTNLFSKDIQSVETNEKLLSEIQQSRELGIVSFPSLLLDRGTLRTIISHHYSAPQEIIDAIRHA
jgi:putative protein-disulfide isomerase